MQKWIEKNKIIAVGIIAVMLIAISVVFYNINSKKVFKDEYMKDIFVENNNSENIEKEDTIKTNVANNKDAKLENEDKLLVVDIKGEVVNSGVYYVKEGTIIDDLIKKAGGLTEEADITQVNRAEKVINNSEVIIPNKNEQKIEGVKNNTNSGITKEGLVNINKATLEELKNINGVGDSKAKAIIDYREQNGGFKSIEDLKNVKGIGEKSFEAMKSQITI